MTFAVDRVVAQESVYCDPGDDPRAVYDTELRRIEDMYRLHNDDRLYQVFVRGDLSLEQCYMLYYVFLVRMDKRLPTFLQLDQEGTFAFYTVEFGLTTDASRLVKVCTTYDDDLSVWLLHMGPLNRIFANMLPMAFRLGHIVPELVPGLNAQQLLRSAILASSKFRIWAEQRILERQIFDKFTRDQVELQLGNPTSEEFDFGTSEPQSGRRGSKLLNVSRNADSDEIWAFPAYSSSSYCYKVEDFLVNLRMLLTMI